MEKVRRYRAMGSLCRQSAVLNPLNSWKLLGDAERWEHLAEVEVAPTSINAIPLAQVTPRSPADLPTRMTRNGRRLSPRNYPYGSGLTASVALRGTLVLFVNYS